MGVITAFLDGPESRGGEFVLDALEVALVETVNLQRKTPREMTQKGADGIHRETPDPDGQGNESRWRNYCKL
jgi:hypothetical protein